MKSPRELVVPVLFVVEGVFWLAVVAAGGAGLLILAALAFIISGALLMVAPAHWVSRPFAGASALFGLVLTLYQVYEAATLAGTGLSTLGVTSGVVFAVFALVSIYLELATLAIGAPQVAAKKP